MYAENKTDKNNNGKYRETAIGSFSIFASC